LKWISFDDEGMQELLQTAFREGLATLTRSWDAHYLELFNQEGILLYDAYVWVQDLWTEEVDAEHAWVRVYIHPAWSMEVIVPYVSLFHYESRTALIFLAQICLFPTGISFVPTGFPFVPQVCYAFRPAPAGFLGTFSQKVHFFPKSAA